jgi:enoyl-CoA hydratase/carnithine racemase
VELVERRDEGAVAVLTLNRPERKNALSGALLEALDAALDGLDADRGVHAAVLTGRGTAFCAGGDLADGMGQGEGFLDAHEGRGRFARLLGRLPALRVPIVAAVNGDALGGGLGIAVACDLAIAEPGAFLGTPEIRVGLFPMMLLAVLQRHVPRKQLLELVLTGGKVPATRAVELGLVNRVSAEGHAVDEAVALASQIAARSPAVVRLGKAAFYQVSDMDYDDALSYLHTQLTLNLLTEDAAEGVGAFLQRREPRWKGR